MTLLEEQLVGTHLESIIVETPSISSLGARQLEPRPWLALVGGVGAKGQAWWRCRSSGHGLVHPLSLNPKVLWG